MRPFGYHISGGQHLGSSLQTAVDTGFTAAQIFLGPPITSKIFELPDYEVTLFKRVKKASGIKVYVHAPYVLHAFAKPENVAKNNYALKTMVEMAAGLDCEGYVLHMGGTKWYQETPDQYITVARKLLEVIYPNGNEICPILFENCASGNAMSGNLASIMELITTLKSDGHNVGLCLDTLHAWAWGCDFQVPDIMVDLLSIVRPALQLLHLNSGPAKVTCGGNYDRHEAIHKGVIDPLAFVTLLRLIPGIPAIAEREILSDVLSDWALVKHADQGIGDIPLIQENL